MSDAAFDALARDDRERVQLRLTELLGRFAREHDGMREAMAYSLLAGGKRLRPLLCLWTHDAFAGAQRGPALDAACALECVHSYSLVHDDLPCMDDDDLRRGQPSTHRRFGEATAVLTGDALLTMAFEVLACMDREHGVGAGEALATVRVIAGASGCGGLITGQALDLAPPERNVETARRIHEFKTAHLIAAAMECGALLAGVGDEARARVRRAGMAAGTAFQIVDDLLDIDGSEDSLGKTPGKDVEGEKLTFPAVVGMESARREAHAGIEAARAALPEAAGRPLEALLAQFTRRGA